MRVNLGCGPHHHRAGWRNADIRPFPGVDLVMDATRPWPVAGVRHVYAEHFVEHLDLDGALDFLVHAGAAMDPGARLRLSTPNLAWVVRRHFPADGDEEARVMHTLRMNLAFHGWGHRFLWTTEMLCGILAAIGYDDVEPCGYGQSDDPVLAGIERHGGYEELDGLPSVVIAEAVRGPRAPVKDPALHAWLDAELLSHVRSGH